MTRAGGTSARFRQRKLSTKQPLQILREDQVEKVDDDQPRNIPKVDTGVEKAEEIVSVMIIYFWGVEVFATVRAGCGRDVSRDSCGTTTRPLDDIH